MVERFGELLAALLGVVGWFLIVTFFALLRPAHSQVFDYPTISPVPLPTTEAENKWFATGFVAGCCNLGDAFVADEAFEKDGRYYAVITDGFDHHPNVMKVIIPPGTIKEIPKEIFKKMSAPGVPQNPTSHGILFLHLFQNGSNMVGYRYASGTGGFASMVVKPEEADVLCYWPGAGT